MYDLLVSASGKEPNGCMGNHGKPKNVGNVVQISEYRLSLLEHPVEADVMCSIRGPY